MVFISRRRVFVENETVKVPEGCMVCPDCKGNGSFRWKWSGQGHTQNDWTDCFVCRGDGYVNIEDWKRWTKITKVKENG
jgi:hypothetical protein